MSDAIPITLAIPYYAGFELLQETLRSLAAQDHPAVSLLVCDDSPSGLVAGEIAQLRELCAPRFPLEVLRNPTNLGMARTWNRCLDAARTDLVTIVHGDDLLEPTYASEMVALAQREPEAAALFSGARIIDERGDRSFSFPDFYKSLLVPAHGETLRLVGDRGLASLMRGNYIFCPTLCYRRSRLGALRFDPAYKMVLDVELTTNLLLSGECLVGVPRKRLYRYRRHSENATEHLTRDLTRFREESEFFSRVAARARAVGFERTARVAAAKRIVVLNLVFCIARDVTHGSWADAGSKLKLLRGLFVSEPSH